MVKKIIATALTSLLFATLGSWPAANPISATATMSICDFVEWWPGCQE